MNARDELPELPEPLTDEGFAYYLYEQAHKIQREAYEAGRLAAAPVKTKECRHCGFMRTHIEAKPGWYPLKDQATSPSEEEIAALLSYLNGVCEEGSEPGKIVARMALMLLGAPLSTGEE